MNAMEATKKTHPNQAPFDLLISIPPFTVSFASFQRHNLAQPARSYPLRLPPDTSNLSFIWGNPKVEGLKQLWWDGNEAGGLLPARPARR
jgi:hypothetical protein